jgi:hypothetical protein
MCFIYLTGINNSYNIELMVFILLISCIFFNLFSSFIIHIWIGHALNINSFISIYTLQIKTSLSYQNIILLVVSCNIICIFKLYIFTLMCDYPTDLKYITLFLSYILISFKENYNLDLYSDSEHTDTDAPHDESGSTDNGGAGSGGPNPPKPDVVMHDGSDSSGDESSDSEDDASCEESAPVIELPNDDSIKPYRRAQSTPSWK